MEDPRVAAVGEAATGRETLEQLRKERWDLVILDIGMPDRNGLDILQQIRAAHTDTRVLVLSGYPERQYALNVLRAGAMGFIDKSAAPEEMLRAVHSVLQGRRYVSATLAELLVGELDGDADKPLHSRLSEREFQVFFKLAGGRSVSEIAAELCLSVKTVSTYRTRILEKMNLQTNADLTSYALRNQLIH
jgi:DNA-binding NarL/FixJ family response regulator